jgi:hypothetical protein
MSKVKLALLLVAVIGGPLAFSQTQTLPAADMAKKMEMTCTGFCHGPGLIAQQRLDRNGWTREVDKMIRWGAAVPASEKDALIEYLTRAFNANRSLPNTFKAVPSGKGSDLFQNYCLGCHDDRPIASRKLDKAGWLREVDAMIKVGAYVPTNRRDELVEYLSMHFGK